MTEKREETPEESLRRIDERETHSSGTRWLLERHAEAPPEKVILTDKDYRPRPGTPGTSEWEEARRLERERPARDEKAQPQRSEVPSKATTGERDGKDAPQ